MSGIFGILGLADSEIAYVNVVGQRVVYDAVQQFLAQHNEELRVAQSLFVDSETEDFKFRYKLPGGGYLQRRGGKAQSAAVKTTGSWDVALPLEDFGVGLGGFDVDLAYMSLQDLQVHLDTVTLQNINTVRLEILKCLFDNVAYTFNDPLPNVGDLTIQPLANGDSVVYPPVLGTVTEATDDHFIGTAYAASAISDTNNPYETIKNEVEEHFGAPTGGSNIISFINPAQTAKTQALSDFDPVNDRFIEPGANKDTIMGLPAGVPGRILGRVSGVWVSEWRWIPANYISATHLDAPKPLRMRVDRAYTGLPRGLNLVAQSGQDAYPLQGSQYRHRFGLAVVNRLNGVSMHLSGNSTYTVPTGYSH
jgi:hypothetical protein